MNHLAVINHKPGYHEEVKEYRRNSRLLRRLLEEKEPNLPEIEEVSGALEFLRIQMDDHQWGTPDWADIEASIPAGQTPVETLTYLTELHSELRQYISEIRKEPEVQLQTHPNIDLIEIYLDGLHSLQDHTGLELTRLRNTVEPAEEQSGQAVIKQVELAPAMSTAPSQDDLAAKERLTLAETAELLQLSGKTISNYVSDGTIPKDCYDASSGPGKRRIFYRSKLKTQQTLVNKKKQGIFLKIQWLSTVKKRDELLELLTTAGYLSSVTLPGRHFTDEGTAKPTSHPLDWIYEGTISEGLAELASVIYMLHRQRMILVPGNEKSLHIPKYMVTHFTLNGKVIKKRTAELAVAKIHTDEGGDYGPRDCIEELLAPYFRR